MMLSRKKQALPPVKTAPYCEHDWNLTDNVPWCKKCHSSAIMVHWYDMDTAPSDGTRVLVLTEDRKVVSVRWMQGIGSAGWTIYRRPEGWLDWLRGGSQWLIISPEVKLLGWMPLPGVDVC